MSRNKHNRLRRKKAKKPTMQTLTLDFESRGLDGRSTHIVVGRQGQIVFETAYPESAERVRQGYERIQRDAAIRRTMEAQLSGSFFPESALLTSSQAEVTTQAFSMDKLGELLERYPVPEHLNSTRDLMESIYRPRLFQSQRDLLDWFTQSPEPSLPSYSELIQIKENTYLQQEDWYDLGDIKVRWLAADEAYTLFQTVKAGESYFTAGCRKNYTLHRAVTHWTSNLHRNGLHQRARLFLAALAKLQKDVL